MTERGGVKEALRKSEERYRSLIESIDEGFCVVEVLFGESDKPTDYRFLEVNPAFERQTGIRDATGRTMREIAPNHEEHWFQIYGMIARTGEPRRFEQWAEALQRFFDVYAFRTGEPSERRVAILLNDITERKKTEEALRTSEERFRYLVESAHEYAIFTADLDMRVTGWNSGAERILGYTEQEILGQSLEVIFTVEDRCSGRPETEKRQALSEGRANDERWHVRKDGSRFWASGFLMPIRDSAGHAVGLVKILRNDTERMKAREELEASNERLQKALNESKQARKEAESANRAKDRFLAVMSHELRTPLTPILMATQLLLKRPDLDKEAVEIIRMIRRNVQLESHLIDDLLDLTRIRSGKFEIVQKPLDLRSVLFDAVEVVRPDIDAKHQKLKTFFDAAEHSVTGDATRLQQVFWNLLKNASKFTPKGGEISIRTWNERDMLAVEVQDTGIGFKQGTMEHIFEAFFQLNRPRAQDYGGLGLGLAIAKAAVEAHGGRILAKSDGRRLGSSFVVRLPQSKNET